MYFFMVVLGCCKFNVENWEFEIVVGVLDMGGPISSNLRDVFDS